MIQNACCFRTIVMIYVGEEVGADGVGYVFSIPNSSPCCCPRKAIHAGDYKRFVVCGHSLGGSVSLLLGMKLRESLLKKILIDLVTLLPTAHLLQSEVFSGVYMSKAQGCSVAKIFFCVWFGLSF